MAPLTLLFHRTSSTGRELLAGALGASRSEESAAPLGELLAQWRATGGTALLVSRAWPTALLAGLLEVHALERNALTLLTTAGMGAGIVRDRVGRIAALSSDAGPEVFGGAFACDLARVPAFTGEISALVALLLQAGAPVGSLHWEGTEQEKPCPLCELDGEPNRESGLLLAGRNVHLAIDSPGFNSGQLICFPRRHITSMVSLNADERAEMSALLRKAEAALRKVYQYDALNLGGNSRPGEHFAMRIIPRWAGESRSGLAPSEGGAEMSRTKRRKKSQDRSFGKLARQGLALLLVVVIALFVASLLGYLDFGKRRPSDPAEMVTAYGESSDYRRALANSPYADLKTPAQPGTLRRISQWAAGMISSEETPAPAAGAEAWRAAPPQEVPPSARVFLANGCAVDRLAGTLRPILREAGFDVCGVDNADCHDYYETLIIDRGGHPGEAQAVAAFLRERWRVGRMLRQVRHSPEADVLVVLGRDLAEILMPERAQAGR